MINFLKNFQQGFEDFHNSIKYPFKWIYLGYVDVFLRYKRSILGPWWITISISLVIYVLSNLWPQILSTNYNFFVPYFAIGYVLWHWFSSSIIESSSSMNEFEGLIKQINIPVSTYLLRISLRNFFIFSHNCLLILIVVIIFNRDVILFDLIFISIPAMFLIFLSLTAIGIIIAILSVRYKDLTSIIGFLMQLLFFITPIIWHPDIINKSATLVEYNLIYYWIDIIRQPLLGLQIHQDSIIVIVISSFVLTLISALLIGKYKKKIIYWL